MLEEKFKNTVGKYDLLKKKDKVILGLSGGPDSVCMLYQFLNIKEEYKLHLVGAHFNHALRKEADQEEDFIKDLCSKVGIKCISERKNVKDFFEGDSLEQTARNLRYDFFLKCTRQTKIKKIALAHHKDDLIETILMRFIKGSGLRGLRGFLPKSKFRSATVIRPLIELAKNEIIDWLRDKKISYCIDKSNFEDKFLRNKIRLKLMPFLKEINPNIVDNLYNLANNLSLDYDFIFLTAYQYFNSLKRGETRNGIKLDLTGLKKLHPSLFNNVIRIAIEEVKGNVRRLESRHLKEIKDLIAERPTGSIVHLPFLVVSKLEKALVISKP
jgi:tRNA(Ile)-lysidine synthase